MSPLQLAMPNPTKTTRLVRDAVARDLEDGERFEVGLRVMLKGAAYNSGVAASRTMFGPLSSHTTGKAQDRLEEERGNAEAIGIPAALNMGWGLTDRRLLILSLDKLTNRPQAVTGTVPLSDLEGVAYRQKLLFGKLTLLFRSGDALEVDVARVEKGRAFVDALEAAIG